VTPRSLTVAFVMSGARAVREEVRERGLVPVAGEVLRLVPGALYAGAAFVALDCWRLAHRTAREAGEA